MDTSSKSTGIPHPQKTESFRHCSMVTTGIPGSKTPAGSMQRCWVVTIFCFILLDFFHFGHGACSEPLGVANAYMTSTAPYNTGDRVYYRCYDGFTMSGTPSQLCDASGVFSGTTPTCTAYDQAVTIRQTVTSPKDDNGWIMLAFGSFVGLILLLLIIFVLVFFHYMYKRQPLRQQQQRPIYGSSRTAFNN